MSSRCFVLVPIMLAALAPACVDDSGSLIIVQNQTPVFSPTGCATPATPTIIRGQGEFDVNLDKPYPYLVYPLVQNRLPPLAGDSPAEPNRVNLDGVQVIVTPPAQSAYPISWDASCPLKFDWPYSAPVDPGESVGIFAQAIPPCLTSQIKTAFEPNANAGGKTAYNPAPDQYVFFNVEIRARGRHGGSTILSDALHMPIRVCYGCLQQDYDYQNPTYYSCKETPAKNPYPGNQCNPAQDAKILCCVDDISGALKCPAPDNLAP